ncbi:MAG: hypothetical protein IPG89_13095 [Bacteroidetes bacterium]|nr:hypothetical protein [Bacteroidota bacterium]
MGRKKGIDIEIDKLTNSIVNVISGEVFETEFNLVSKKEIKKSDWLFDWSFELKDKNSKVFKMTTTENKGIIQGLLSYSIEENFVFVNLVENAKFNRGKEKLYEGVGGNLFAYSCKLSYELGFGGFVSFKAKTALIEYYKKSLGAEIALGQRMYIDGSASQKLINQYFKNK